MTADQTIEAATADAFAHQTAPRVTPADLEAAIASEFFFTAADGVLGESEMGTRPAGRAASLSMITFCVLVLRNGHRVVGVNTGPVSAANFDPVKGRQMARDHALEQLWLPMGYALRDRLHAAQHMPAPSYAAVSAAVWATYDKPRLETHELRVVGERNELSERLGKLSAFVESPAFAKLEERQRILLASQHIAMTVYRDILDERIAGFAPRSTD